ncbi:MAG: DUF1289 domain-containing protein [Qingshengfaniella sp.]
MTSRRPRRRRGGLDSPCINLCTIEPRTRRCAGCHRTIDEISRWATMSTGQRRRIMADLPRRAPAPDNTTP